MDKTLNFSIYYGFNFDNVAMIMKGKEILEGFNINRASESPPEELLCKICQKIPRRMDKQYGCYHKFCNHCLSEVKGVIGSLLVNNCPLCGECFWPRYNRIKLKDNHKHENMDKTWKRIRIKCNQGCDFNVWPEDANVHELRVCPHRPILCPNVGCLVVVKSSRLKEHYLQCPFTPIYCGTCKLYYPKHEKAEHDCVASLKRAINACKVKLPDWEQRIQEKFPNLYTLRQVQKEVVLRFHAPIYVDGEYASNDEIKISLDLGSDWDSDALDSDGEPYSDDSAKVQPNVFAEKEALMNKSSSSSETSPSSHPTKVEAEMITANESIDSPLSSKIAEATVVPSICENCGLLRKTENHSCIQALRIEWDGLSNIDLTNTIFFGTHIYITLY